MSTLNVANISDRTDTVETGYVVNGSAKVLAFFSTTGTVTLVKSLNVSSLTDQGTGSTATNFVTSFGDDDYITTSMSGNASASTAFTSDYANRTAGLFDVVTRNTNNSSIDCNRVSLSIHGDLA